MPTVGKVEDLAREFTFEWKIDNFFTLSEECYASPLYTLDGESWCLSIYPNGDSEHNSVGYISVYLRRIVSGPSKSLAWSFALRTLDGKKVCEAQLSHVFTETHGWGFHRFLQRFELLKNKLKMVPSDVLTIVCTIELCHESNDDAGDAVQTKCPYCSGSFVGKYFLSHQQKCLYKPIRCPTCTHTVILKHWLNLECPMMRLKATKKLVDDLSSIIQKHEHSDVTVKVKGQEFKLHRVILAGRNPYFEALLNTEMKEKVTGLVYINDCEPDIFGIFIKFVYTGKMDDLTVKNVCDSYVLADKYQEDQLKAECLNLMKKEMSVDTFCDFTELALKYDEKELLNDATDLFCREIKEIIKSVRWQSFISQNPIEANELNIRAIDYMSNKLQELMNKT